MSEYKPVDLGDVLARANRLRQFDGATFYDIAEGGEEDEVAGLAQELAGQDVPELVAEVRYLRSVLAELLSEIDEQESEPPRWAEPSERSCPHSTDNLRDMINAALGVKP